MHDARPVRAAEPAFFTAPAVAPRDDIQPESQPGDPTHARRGTVAVAMLVIGLFVGAAGGFMVGQRMAPPSPSRSADVAPSAPSSSTPSADSTRLPAEPPAAAQDYTSVEPAGITSAPLPPMSVATPPAKPVSARPASGATARPAATAAPAAAVRSASVQFASRPGGAVVYLNDRRVGTTPLTMREVSPGTHRVRMELAGHRPWTTTIAVAPGGDVRVGASLEQ